MERAKVACLLVLLFASLIAATATNRYWSGNASSTSIMTKATSVTNISSYNTWYHNGSLCLWNVTNWWCVSNWSDLNASGGGGGGSCSETYNGTFNSTSGGYVYNDTDWNITFNETKMNETIDARSGGAASAPNRSVQFNYNNVFAGDAAFTWDDADNKLVVVSNGSFGYNLVVNGTYGNTSFTGNNIDFGRRGISYITATHNLAGLSLGAGGTSSGLFLKYNTPASTLYLDQVGVAIGKSGADVKLDVVGDVNVSENVTSPKYCFPDTTCFNASNFSAGGGAGGSNGSIQFNYNDGFYGASNFTIDFANNYLNVFNRAGLLFWNGTNYAGFRAGVNAGNNVWNLPSSDGEESQVLQTDGEGNLSWATVYGSGVLTWVNPVLDKDLTTPPALNATGDRYIVGWTASGWYDGAWAYRSEINISHAQVQGDWSGEIYGLNLVDDAHDVFKYSTNGNDFVFTESDGVTPIEAFCLERFNAGAAKNVTTVWLRLDGVNNVTNKTIYLYYGNPSASSASDCETTFGSDRGLFYDLTTSGVDYTVNGRDASVLGAVTDNKYSFPAGWASDFPQSSTGYFNLKDIAYWEQQWYKRIHMIVFTPNENNERQTVFAEGGGTNGMQLYIDTDASLHAFWWSRSNSMTDVDVVWDNPVVVGETYYAILAFDGNAGLWAQADLWVNGTPQALGPASPDKAYINAHSGDGGVGSTGKNTKLFHDGAKATSFFNGTIDYFATADDPDDDIFGVDPDEFAFNWFSALSNATGFWSVGAATTPSGGASGAWAGYEQNITEWNGTGWDFYDPEAGWATYVVDEQSYYSFDGTNWGLMSGQISHQALTQLQGGYDTGDIATSEYYHLNESNYTVATREATQTQSGIMPSGKLGYWDTAYAYRLEAIDTDYSSVFPVDARFGVVGDANIWTNASDNYQNVSIYLNDHINLSSVNATINITSPKFCFNATDCFNASNFTSGGGGDYSPWLNDSQMIFPKNITHGVNASWFNATNNVTTPSVFGGSSATAFLNLFASSVGAGALSPYVALLYDNGFIIDAGQNSVIGVGSMGYITGGQGADNQQGGDLIVRAGNGGDDNLGAGFCGNGGNSNYNAGDGGNDNAGAGSNGGDGGNTNTNAGLGGQTISNGFSGGLGGEWRGMSGDGGADFSVGGFGGNSGDWYGGVGQEGFSRAGIAGSIGEGYFQAGGAGNSIHSWGGSVTTGAGILNFDLQSRARVYLDNPQAVPCGMPTKILFDVPNYDNRNEMGGAGVETYTALQDGVVDVKCGYWIDGEEPFVQGDIIYVDIYLNGAPYTTQTEVYGGREEYGIISIDIADHVPVNQGDTIECYADCSAMMGVINLMTGTQYTYLTVHKAS